MAFNEDKQIEELIKLYREGFLNVIDVIQRKEAKKQNTVFYKDQLRQILGILQDLDDKTADWINKTIPGIYKDKQNEVTALVQKIGMQRPIRNEFAQIHKRAIDAAAENIGDNFRSALNFAGRRISDEYRKIGLAAAGSKIVAGRTVKEMAQDLADRLTAAGLPALKDRAGRTWSMENYTRMVARTTTREIGSIATQNTCAEYGCDYVYIPYHPLDKEDICAQYADKVYCISGNDPKYPKFTEECRPPYHPNCRHTLQPYAPAIRDMTDDEIDALIQEAPDILNKIGYQMPPAARKADPGQPKAPAAAPAPAAAETAFTIDEFREELKKLPPAERYKKAILKAREFIDKDLKDILNGKPGRVKYKIDNEVIFAEGMNKYESVTTRLNIRVEEYLKKFNGLKSKAEQKQFIEDLKNIADKSESPMQIAKAAWLLEDILNYSDKIPNYEIWEKIGRAKLTPDQKEKLKLKSDTKYRDQKFINKMNEATDFLTTYIYGEAAPARGIQLNKLRSGARAYASGGIINVAPEDGTPVFVHEAAHVIHDYNKGIEDLVREFFKDRTAGEDLETIYSGTTERGFKDHFFKHYVGKVYQWERLDPKGTEVLSMGLQEMYNDPMRFYNQDPGHFELIYAIMRGFY